MKYNKVMVMLFFITVLLLLSGCRKDIVVDEDIVIDEDLIIDMETDYLSDLDAQIEAENKKLKDKYGKDNYDYSIYDNNNERVEFYKNHEIYYGEEKLQEEDKYLIYVFNPTCEYCQNFYEVLKVYVEKENSLPIYAINIAVFENQDIIYDYNVEGTPTTLVYNKITDTVEEVLVGSVSIEDIPLK